MAGPMINFATKQSSFSRGELGCLASLAMTGFIRPAGARVDSLGPPPASAAQTALEIGDQILDRFEPDVEAHGRAARRPARRGAQLVQSNGMARLS